MFAGKSILFGQKISRRVRAILLSEMFPGHLPKKMKGFKKSRHHSVKENFLKRGCQQVPQWNFQDIFKIFYNIKPLKKIVSAVCEEICLKFCVKSFALSKIRTRTKNKIFVSYLLLFFL